MKRVNWRVAAIAALAGLLGFALHVAISTRTMPLVGQWMQGRSTLRPPYPWDITAMAAATSLLPAIGATLVGWATYPKLPGANVATKGVSLGLLILLVKGELVRTPLMGLMIGNPAHVVVVQQADKWIANLAMGVVIAAGIELVRRRDLGALR